MSFEQNGSTGAAATPDGPPGARVGIVLVSHSARLAEGLAELAAEFGGDVPVAAAGGTEDGGLGTSIDKVDAAVRAVDRGAGVVLLADLGSAVLTVRTLLEEGGTEGAGLPRDVVLADAPLVEGTVAAVVSAAIGGDVASVVIAAEEARLFRKL